MVHTFKALDAYYTVDSESGSIFEVDEITAGILSGREGIDLNINKTFSAAETTEAEKEIDALIKEGVLFSPAVNEKPVTKTAVKALCLNISHDCNLRCRYCFAGEGNYNGERELMAEDTAHRAIDMLIIESGSRRNLEIDFFGGEPLLNFGVVESAVKYAKKQALKNDKKFRFTITTNALLLKDGIIDFLNSEMANVVISIDGRREVHNNVRRSVNNKDVYDVIINNALAFKEKRGDKDYYIRGTYTAENTDFASDIETLLNYGFDKLSVEPVVLPDMHSLSIKEEHLDRIGAEYEKLARLYVDRHKQGKPFTFFHYMLSFNNSPCLRKLVTACGAGCEYLAVSPGGAVYPCHQFVGIPEYKIGDAGGVLDRAKMKALEESTIYSKDDCGKCWAKYFCSGGCAANNYNYFKDINTPHKISCGIMKKRLEFAIAVNNRIKN